VREHIRQQHLSFAPYRIRIHFLCSHGTVYRAVPSGSRGPLLLWRLCVCRMYRAIRSMFRLLSCRFSPDTSSKASTSSLQTIHAGWPAVTDRDGCTPLYCAAAWNRIEAVRLLEKLQCPSSLRSLEGRTPVHVAAEQVRALLRCGCAAALRVCCCAADVLLRCGCAAPLQMCCCRPRPPERAKG
jgi:hypothetical protein